jgi:hypothetical protein
MAVPNAISQTYQEIGMREDLSDMIFNISPTETPFQSAVGKAGKATATLHEWQTDSLSSTTTNAQIEGDDMSALTATPTVRLQNYLQIATKGVVVSGTLEAVLKAGRKSELAYQIAKRGKELKRDMEFALTQNQAGNAGSASAGRKLRALENWYATNPAGGTSYATATGITATVTDGTQRAFTESLLKTVCRNVFNSGGDPTMLMVGPFNKQVVSTFTGNATRMDKSEDKKLYAAIDVYASDYGELKVVPNRFSRDRTAHVLDLEYWAVSFLRPITMEEIAKTGDSSKKMIITEYTLESRNEAASGAVADLTTS